MRSLWAITFLTWKAAFRFRLFWVLTVLLLGSVVLLPLLLKDDQTARGFTQILLTYNLGVITTLLGISTLWLGCGTLARDIQDAQIQMVATKPVPRWKIWVGKWLGIMMLDAVLLAIAGTSVFVLLQYRARQLPVAQQKVLREEIFVARGSIKEPVPDLEQAVERAFAEALKNNPVPAADQPLLRHQIGEQFKARLQIVSPGQMRVWALDLGLRHYSLRDQPLWIRVKFYAAQTNLSGSYLGRWVIGTSDQTPVWETTLSQAPETFHEFKIPPNLFDRSGVLRIAFINQNDTRILFPLDEGLEVLYREGGFGLNYSRGLGIIFCWLGLLAAMGLAAASLLSFPVAAFCSLSLLVVALSTGTLSTLVAEGATGGADHETGEVHRGFLDFLLIPLFKGILKVVNLAEAFSPVAALSSGRSISWEHLGMAFFQVIIILGGFFALLGIVILNRRELATAPAAA